MDVGSDNALFHLYTPVMLQNAILILIVLAIISANLPWFSERFFLLLTPPGGAGKRLWMCLLEWVVLLIVFLLGALGLEQKLMGELYRQDWEFYAVIFCLYVVFALPGFIYRFDLRPHLNKRQRRSK